MPTAYVVHTLPGRVRLRIPAKRGDANYFEELRRVISGFPGIEVAAVNPLTASILIRYPPELDIAAVGEVAGAFDIVYGELPTATVAERLDNWLARGDRVLRRGSGGHIDFKSASVLTLLALALRQAAQGEILQPAFPLLLGALAVLHGAAPKE